MCIRDRITFFAIILDSSWEIDVHLHSFLWRRCWNRYCAITSLHIRVHLWLFYCGSAVLKVKCTLYYNAKRSGMRIIIHSSNNSSSEFYLFITFAVYTRPALVHYKLKRGEKNVISNVGLCGCAITSKAKINVFWNFSSLH